MCDTNLCLHVYAHVGRVVGRYWIISHLAGCLCVRFFILHFIFRCLLILCALWMPFDYCSSYSYLIFFFSFLFAWFSFMQQGLDENCVWKENQQQEDWGKIIAVRLILFNLFNSDGKCKQENAEIQMSLSLSLSKSLMTYERNKMEWNAAILIIFGYLSSSSSSKIVYRISFIYYCTRINAAAQNMGSIYVGARITNALYKFYSR